MDQTACLTHGLTLKKWQKGKIKSKKTLCLYSCLISLIIKCVICLLFWQHHALDYDVCELRTLFMVVTLKLFNGWFIQIRLVIDKFKIKQRCVNVTLGAVRLMTQFRCLQIDSCVNEIYAIYSSNKQQQ